MNPNFSGPSMGEVDPNAIGVVISVGLALVRDEAIKDMTGGILKPPAAVIVADLVTRVGVRTSQMLTSADSLAALHGALQAWSRDLPTAARDQYEATVAEADQRYSQVVAEFRNGGGWR
ncbi:hypothetical protein GCM10010168_86300 [Actinoplanes ianthinogenes]|uniref:Uncharacterized protein n=1 Tax=Actinoplanes ianthinogenes TaxID=122358 RepID=A0ABN6CK51_9ACTN|nr:hypothetical protein [Actinoplanes ianthinogenes]BCJ45361.1 hypothetical protein Aiant_60180 [Actinoplanes ianthinogenes]GGR54013.1 hypothetical protein GCM10010168_86300 [Actinoplanes ianthinogenes]